MTIATKSAAEATANWTQVTPGRAGVYATNAAREAPKWLSNFLAALPAWRAAMSASGLETRMSSRASGRGLRRYPAKIASVGQARFSEGIGKASPDYSASIGPVLTTIQGVTLPTKGPKGDPRNYRLVDAVGDALHRAKLSAQVGGG